MPPKKKGGKKKGKKAAGRPDPPPPEPDEFDGMATEQLREQILDLKSRLERAQLDRNQVQLDRDMIQRFYTITQQEVDDSELKILGKDREMELMEENHRVEVRVYQQKVKHLEYEHSNTLDHIQGDTKHSLEEEGGAHTQREVMLRKAKRMYKLELQEREEQNAEAIAEIKRINDANLEALRRKFDTDLNKMDREYVDRYQKLESDLELRRKVEIHEIEERKNLHINQLMKSHEEAFEKMRSYYNDVTRGNIEVIKSLKAEVAQRQKKKEENAKLMQSVAEENQRLIKPLKIATEKVESLKADLRDAEKHRMSLRNSKARVLALEKELLDLAKEHKKLNGRYEELKKERDELYHNFEATIKAVQRRSEFKNLVLEQKVSQYDAAFQKKEAQLDEVLSSANLDPAVVPMIADKLEEVLGSRNSMIRDLQYSIARVAKAHNDVLRVYEAKLQELGVDPMDATAALPVASTTSTGPAGLVAKPKF